MIPISVQLFVLGFATATGFVAAGLVASLYQLVTAEPARFALLGESLPAWLLTFVFCAVAGPFILTRGLLRRGRGARSPGLLLGGVAVAAIWSSCSGLIVLDIALAAQTSFG